MNSMALILMIFSVALIWGGLLFSIIHLIKHPDIPMEQLQD